MLDRIETIIGFISQNPIIYFVKNANNENDVICYCDDVEKWEHEDSEIIEKIKHHVTHHNLDFSTVREIAFLRSESKRPTIRLK